MKNNQTRGFAFGLFFLSGFVSLVFQIVWMKMLVLIFGNTIWAVTTLLTAFMAGLALGSWIFGRIADQVGSPLRLYGIIEALIGVMALFTIFIFGNLDILYRPLYNLFGGDNFLMGIIKFLLAFLILVIPTALMGGTLPLLARQFTEKVKNAGTSIGSLYMINTFGAVAGTLVCAFLFIPAFGIKMSIVVGALINFLILLVILSLTRDSSAKIKIKGLFKIDLKGFKHNYVLWIFFGCGFAALAYEVFWSRILVLHIGSSVYAYAIMLGIYLMGIALGSGLMSYFLPKIKNPGLAFGIVQFLIAIDIMIQLKQFGTLAFTITNMGNVMGVESYPSFIGSLIMSTAQVILIPTLLFGASFPLAVKLFVNARKNIGAETGTLYAFNTVGTIFGSFLAGFFFLPLMGVQKSIAVMGLLNIFLGFFLLYKHAKSKLNIILATLVLVMVFVSFNLFLVKKDEVLLTAGVFTTQPGSEVEILNFSEDIYATVSVEERTDVRGTWKSLSLNGVNVAGTSCELFTIQKMQGHLPLMLHDNPESVLHIGFGSGGTAWAVSRYPVKEIVIAEISKSIIEKSSKYFKDVNHGVLEDERVKVHYTDGRNFVLATDRKFDVILSDSIHPRFSGNGSLYTYDYYKLLKERLKPGGVVSQWLPYYSVTPENFKMIIKSFYEVFPNTSVWYVNSTFNDYVIVIGKLGDGKFDFNSMREKLMIPEVKADLAEIDTDNVFKVLDYFLFANDKVKEFCGDVRLHTDDNIAVEYESGRVLSKITTSNVSFASLIESRTSVIPYLEIDASGLNKTKGDIIDIMTKFELATSFNLEGQLLFDIGKRQEAYKNFNMIPIYNPVDLEPVEYFGSSYQKAFLRYATLQ